MTRIRQFRSAFVGLLLALLAPAAVHAQDDEAAEWATAATLGASVFFGNTSQTALLTSVGTTYESSVLALSSAAAFAYGEARDPEGVSSVNKRSWNLSSQIDFDPTNPFNLFVSGKVESVFEKRIDLRWNAGGGARYQFIREDENRASVALAVLGEQTRPRDSDEIDTVAKWSARLRYTRQLAGGMITFSSDTQFEPELEDLEIYTLSSTNSFTFQLTEGLALQLQLVDEYDTEAEARGARTNNDGRLFVSVVTTF